MGQQGTVWTRTTKDRESWRTLAEGYFLQWKDTTYSRVNRIPFDSRLESKAKYLPIFSF